MPLVTDLLNPPLQSQRRVHKKKRLVQSPNSFHMDVKCPKCSTIIYAFSHSQTVVPCTKCQMILCQPTGGRARISEGVSIRRKQN